MKNIHKILLLLTLVTPLSCFQLFATNAFSYSDYYTSQGCADCHTATTTCNGCHAHGTHSSKAKDNINVAGATNKTSYTAGETVTVTITGGYRTDWIRAVLYDQNGKELKRSSGNASGQGGSTTYPATLSAAAPATPGTYTWKVAWYGNSSETGVFGAGWLPDASNPDHGYEIVNTNSFTVVQAAPTISTVVPNSLAQGAVNQSVTISGTNLTGGAISFSNAGVTGGTATVSATTITLPVSVTAGATTGAGTITVTTSGGSVSSAFTVTAPPQNQLNVTTGGTGSGSVNSSNLAGIACSSGSPAGCSASFAANASVDLTESPSNGSVFGGWTGDCSSFGTAATCTVTMSAARNVVATFNTSTAVAMINSTGYSTLSAAYSAAASDSTIRIIGATLTGDLTIDKSITLDGGYNAAFAIKTGSPTVLSGIITISTGSMTAGDIAIL